MQHEKATSAQPALTVSVSNEIEVVKSSNSQVGAQPHLTVSEDEISTNVNSANENVGALTLAQKTPTKGGTLISATNGESQQSWVRSEPAVTSQRVHTAANPAEVGVQTDFPRGGGENRHAIRIG